MACLRGVCVCVCDLGLCWLCWEEAGLWLRAAGQGLLFLCFGGWMECRSLAWDLHCWAPALPHCRAVAWLGPIRARLPASASPAPYPCCTLAAAAAASHLSLLEAPPSCPLLWLPLALSCAGHFWPPLNPGYSSAFFPGDALTSYQATIVYP